MSFHDFFSFKNHNFLNTANYTHTHTYIHIHITNQQQLITLVFSVEERIYVLNHHEMTLKYTAVP